MSNSFMIVCTAVIATLRLRHWRNNRNQDITDERENNMVVRLDEFALAVPLEAPLARRNLPRHFRAP